MNISVYVFTVRKTARTRLSSIRIKNKQKVEKKKKYKREKARPRFSSSIALIREQVINQRIIFRAMEDCTLPTHVLLLDCGLVCYNSLLLREHGAVVGNGGSDRGAAAQAPARGGGGVLLLGESVDNLAEANVDLVEGVAACGVSEELGVDGGVNLFVKIANLVL